MLVSLLVLLSSPYGNAFVMGKTLGVVRTLTPRWASVPEDGRGSVKESDRVSRLEKVLETRSKEKSSSANPGFTRLSESINGRIAMLGFVGVIFREYTTGQSIFEQVGISSSSVQGLKEVVLVVALGSLAFVTSKLGLGSAGSLNVDDLPL